MGPGTWARAAVRGMGLGLACAATVNAAAPGPAAAPAAPVMATPGPAAGSLLTLPGNVPPAQAWSLPDARNARPAADDAAWLSERLSRRLPWRARPTEPVWAINRLGPEAGPATAAGSVGLVLEGRLEQLPATTGPAPMRWLGPVVIFQRWEDDTHRLLGAVWLDDQWTATRGEPEMLALPPSRVAALRAGPGRETCPDTPWHPAGYLRLDGPCEGRQVYVSPDGLHRFHVTPTAGPPQLHWWLDSGARLLSLWLPAGKHAPSALPPAGARGTWMLRDAQTGRLLNVWVGPLQDGQPHAQGRCGTLAPACEATAQGLVALAAGSLAQAPAAAVTGVAPAAPASAPASAAAPPNARPQPHGLAMPPMAASRALPPQPPLQPPAEAWLAKAQALRAEFTLVGRPFKPSYGVSVDGQGRDTSLLNRGFLAVKNSLSSCGGRREPYQAQVVGGPGPDGITFYMGYWDGCRPSDGAVRYADERDWAGAVRGGTTAEARLPQPDLQAGGVMYHPDNTRALWRDGRMQRWYSPEYHIGETLAFLFWRDDGRPLQTYNGFTWHGPLAGAWPDGEGYWQEPQGRWRVHGRIETPAPGASRSLALAPPLRIERLVESDPPAGHYQPLPAGEYLSRERFDPIAGLEPLGLPGPALRQAGGSPAAACPIGPEILPMLPPGWQPWWPSCRAYPGERQAGVDVHPAAGGWVLSLGARLDGQGRPERPVVQRLQRLSNGEQWIAAAFDAGGTASAPLVPREEATWLDSAGRPQYRGPFDGLRASGRGLCPAPGRQTLGEACEYLDGERIDALHLARLDAARARAEAAQAAAAAAEEAARQRRQAQAAAAEAEEREQERQAAASNRSRGPDGLALLAQAMTQVSREITPGLQQRQAEIAASIAGIQRQAAAQQAAQQAAAQSARQREALAAAESQARQQEQRALAASRAAREAEQRARQQAEQLARQQAALNARPAAMASSGGGTASADPTARSPALADTAAAREDYFGRVRSGLRLAARQCYGDVVATGTPLPRPKPAGVGCVRVDFSARCRGREPGTRGYFYNYVGGSSCFEETRRIEPALPCGPADIEVEVAGVSGCD